MDEEAMQTALRECVKRLGTGILADRSRFRGVINDMLPGNSFDNERKLLIFAADNLSLGEKLLNAPGGEAARAGFFQYQLKEITDCGLSREAAETVLRAFAAALGWQAPGFVGGVNGGSNGGGSLQPNLPPGSCAHRNIDFFANSCRDCGQTLYGIFEDNNFTPYEAMRKKERNGVLISIGGGYGGVFVVPEHITALDDDCLSDHADLQDVILPVSLRSIGSYAFENCSSLKKLKVPESVTVIGAGAFKGLRRVYYSGPATGSPWGAREHVVPPKPVAAPAVQQNTSQPAPSAQQLPSYSNKQVGERFEFGRYPQGANGEVKPITWRVLRRDSDGLLVIAEYGLDAKPYNERLCNITWEKCTLRRWLNGEFLQKAFNAQEQSKIKPSRLDNNAGPATEDRVFLLSIDEAESLFNGDDDRIITPAAYAIANGAYTWDWSKEYSGNAWWWLRSRGHYSDDAADVDPFGSINDCGRVDNASGAVRPAFKLSNI